MRLFAAAMLMATTVVAQEYVYVGEIRPDSVLIGWGTTRGRNTIGRTSAPMGAAVVEIDGRSVSESARNHVWVTGLAPDKAYPYKVRVGGREIGGGEVRTWPTASDKLIFFVIGDYGVGGPDQSAIADAMRVEADRSGPVRFVLTLGDNLYGDLSEDKQWDDKFYRPFRALLTRIPIYPAPGNHDGDESQAKSNLELYLDNFLMPTAPVPGTHAVYSFRFGALAEFFALDSTKNIPTGIGNNYAPGGAQSRWLEGALPASTTKWKIPYFHHPIYCGGHSGFFSSGHKHLRGKDEEHPDRDLGHWVDLFEKHRVPVVFNGHEHNLQYTNPSDTGGVRYIVSGAGGKRSGGKPKFAQYKIAGWSEERHFLKVSIDGGTMRIDPIGAGATPITAKGASGQTMPPLVVTVP
jgi:hypothetical protein